MHLSLSPRLIMLVGLLLVGIVSATAQPYKGLKPLYKGQYDLAIAEFQKPGEEPGDDVIALYGMAMIFRDTAYSNYQLDSAYALSERAYAAFRKLPAKEKEYLNNDLDPSVSALRSQIAGQALKVCEKAKTLEAYNHYLSFYSSAPESRLSKAKEAWTQLLNEKVGAANTWQAASQLVQAYGANMETHAPATLAQLNQQLFKGYFKEKGIDGFAEFARQYPQHPYVKDNIKTKYDALDTPEACEKFVAAYPPDNAFVTGAIDKQADLVIKSKDMNAIARFLSKNAKHARAKEAWLAHYELYLTQNNYDPAAIEQYQRKYAGFPYPERLQSDQKAGAGKVYENLMRNGNKEQLLGFIKKYPDYAKLDSVWTQVYTLTKKEDGSLPALERFEKNNPQFPNKTLLNKDKAAALDEHYKKVMADKDLALYRQFVDKYGQYKNINALWKRYLELHTVQAEDASELESFKAQYPKFPFPKELDAAIAAQRKKDVEKVYLSLKENERTPLKDWFAYLDQYPATPHKAAIETQLSANLLENGDQVDIEDFLKRFPKTKERPALLKKLYPLYTADGKKTTIEAFEKKYPDFPDKARIQDDKRQSSVDISKYAPAKRTEFEVFIRQNAPREKACQALLKILESKMLAKDWDEAHAEALTFQDAFGDNCECYNQIVGGLAPPDAKLKPKSLSDVVNTPGGSEYSAAMSIDEKTLYFCGESRAKSLGGEDIFVSYQKDGQWTDPQPIRELNTPDGHEAPMAISADGNRMVLFSDGKLCLSDKTATGWSKPKALPLTVNRAEWQADARITADGKAILFASGPGNSYGIDIYVSLLQPDGNWGRAISLGPKINTESNDRSPFLHPDMKTLYFSSDRPGGLGKLDMYVSKRLDDTWTNWSTPINLGRNVNTPDYDYDLKVSTDGNTAYLSVINTSLSTGDICQMPLPKAYRPEKVKTINCSVLDINKKPIDAVIVWLNLATGDTIQITRPDPVTGDFVATVPSNIKVGYYAYKKGYLTVSGYVPAGADTKTSGKCPFIMVTAEEMKANNLALPLNNLFFETAKYAIQAESYPELNRLAEWVKENELNIEISGHTDNVGNDDSNQTLSENRANAVRSYLIKKGCQADRISAKGFGETKPVASNDAPEGRAQNRRVEFRIRE